jgi:nitronate monooxygenase/enoyl-[acyl-carrier protein] reductase II
MTALREQRVHDLVPFAGQTAGLIHDIRPANEIVRRIIAEAEQALSRYRE